MPLLGTPLLVVLGLLTALLPAVAVILWPRVRGPRAARTTARVGLVAAAQLAAVLLVAAAANDYGYFYGSWRDLWAGLTQAVTGSSGTSVVIAGVAAGSHGPLAAGGVTVTSHHQFTQASRASRGLLETVVIHGAISGLSEQAHIYLPPQYFQPRYAHTRFPAAEVFTGYPGSNKQLIGRLHYERLLLRDLHRHTAGPMVLVMMRSAVVYPRDTECTDVPGGPQVETFFAQDVPQQVAGRYRVIPNGWGTVGDSTGGYCAAKVTMTNPYTFHAAASLSGYFTTLQDNTTGNLWGGSNAVRDQNNLDWRLQHLPAPPVSVLVTTSRGEGGPLGIQNSQRFMSLAHPPLRISSIIEPHGGHNFTTWLPEIPKALGWLSSRLPPPSRA